MVCGGVKRFKNGNLGRNWWCRGQSDFTDKCGFPRIEVFPRKRVSIIYSHDFVPRKVVGEKRRLITINKRGEINGRTSRTTQTGLSCWRSSWYVIEKERRWNPMTYGRGSFFFLLHLHCDASRALTWLCGVIYDGAFAHRNATICVATRFLRLVSRTAIR